MVDLAETIWRDFETDGVPSSGTHKPRKVKLREWGTYVESFVAAIGTSGGYVFNTAAELYLDMTPALNSMAWVVNDPVPATYNGIWQRTSGGSGWTRVADLPYSFIKASDAGAGTANAIVATSSIPIGSAFTSLILMNVFEANTGSVTITINGGTARPLVTNTGNPLASGYLAAGMFLAFVFDGSNYRLITDIVSSSIVAAAEAAAADAAQSAIDAAAYSPAWLLPDQDIRGGDMVIEGRNIYLGDDAQLVTGQEYLAAWYKALADEHDAVAAGGALAPVYAFTFGDSKVAGTGTTVGSKLDELLDFSAQQRGFTTVDFGRVGVGGEDTGYFATTGMASLKAVVTFPDSHLTIINCGTNEQVPTALTLAQTRANMESIIDQLWDTGSGGLSQDELSIIIMGQTTANNDAPVHMQTQELMRELNSLYREIAREKGCCFIDCYSILRDPHSRADWMDDVTPGKHVHPGDNMNAAIVSFMADIIFPRALEARAGFGPGNHADTVLRYPTTVAMTQTSLPSAWPFGRTVMRAVTTSSAWPIDGIVTTHRHPSRIAEQWLVARQTGETQFRSSVGSSDTWNSWKVVSTVDFSQTGANDGRSMTSSDCSSSRNATGSLTHYRFWNPNGLVGSISTSASATAYTTSSDKRLKDVLADFDPGTIIDALGVYQFKWKVDGRDGWGVMAQDAYEVFPDAVAPGGDGEPGEDSFQPWSVDYSKFVPLLLREVQLLRQRVFELEAE